MSDQPPHSGGRSGSGPDPLDEGGLEELRQRLDALQGSVERLGTDAPPGPPPGEPAYPPASYSRAQHGGPASAPPPEDPHAEQYAEPAPPPVPEQGAPPAPAATNGHTDESPAPAAISASIATLDAGPFRDLIELREFEETLAALESVRDVRVRRFGHGRAEIEIGMAGAHALIRELQRLGRPMHVEQAPGGEVVVQLPDPDPAPSDPAASSPAAEAKQVAGDERAGGGD